MQKISIAVLAIIIILAFFLYQFFFSFSSILREDKFGKDDIITSEDYTINTNDLTKVLLLANQNKLGLIIIKKDKYGFWKNDNISSIIENPSEYKFVTVSMAIMKGWEEEAYSEKHIFVAFYTEKEINPEIVKTSDFYLDVNYFLVNDRILLFAHAIADKKSFGSDEVISFLQEYYD